MTLLNDREWRGNVFTGAWRPAKGGDAPVVSPTTGSELGRIGVANAADVAEAAENAAEAQRHWAAASFEERAAVLRRAGAKFEEEADEIAEWLMREAGSARGKAGFEVHLAVTESYECAALASQPTGEVLRSAQPRLSLARRVPAGVVGVIAPFNFPLILGMRSVAPALALGNAVLLKPDPRTAVSGGAVIAEVFREAGLPEGLLQMLPGGAEAGEALVADRHVRVVSFTGSTAAGRKVGEAAGRHLKRAHLELGGNSPLIVLEDADVERAASVGAWGSFLHQGQICMTTGRHIVHESLADAYVERLAAKAEALTVGDPEQEGTALGPIIDIGQRDRIHDLVTRSVEAGAELRAGGTYDAQFYRPTVLDRVTPETPAYSEEVFGPVAPVIRFSTLDEAAEIAAASDYGLSLGILTGNPMRGMELADRIPSGIVHINDQTVDDEAVAPFGGVGASGTGARFGGTRANLEAFTETQWVTMQSEIKRYPF
ncbi:benzaldehyde dehydrogenase [Streptomonospora nanhaiensis]|uniref:Benzaldehyde dehydrogenase (NAD) n=1 Tax=Streptomonospora nanhaiensis TaxID=1323731 RepID=A0A853BJY5_9ACTN|nr:benzaldehyde dehydrogenase [Streptomonospora nanhaiensis]MBV2362983.1 benzaldehyde dehydrogenase [Streptomonospora nanhaiensis]MBX9390970.1 benzaldehyde dehydrogenase [Streptomonospora nanhaiensis]NYI95350.1 benzaldehyde dehydrogenase (NAD) [Streptomonospora nanhaiensis]